ncbi:pentraxin fusion protein-like [Bolinopsis microptera]|uniref:pentraxin fusion protein-like n=1 Tax=Bolinopsis microptera TaxID=2820187 RepID=UPI003079EAE5
MVTLRLLPLIVMITTVFCHDPNIALRFGDDLTSYIMLSPNMAPLEESLSLCSWVKQLSPESRTGCILHYRTINRDEITLSDNLVWAYLLTMAPHNVTPVHSQWYHVCLTWTFSSRTKSLYYNGQKVGTRTTSSGRKFDINKRAIVIGQHHHRSPFDTDFYSGKSFAGELAKLNIFKRRLSDEEVAGMYSSGICSSYEESLAEDNFLSWTTLLGDETERHGNVVKFNLTCSAHTHEVTRTTTAPPPTSQPTAEAVETCNNRWGLLQLSDYYNKEVTTELLEDLRDRWEQLAEFRGHLLDDALIAHLSKHHCNTDEE